MLSLCSHPSVSMGNWFICVFYILIFKPTLVPNLSFFTVTCGRPGEIIDRINFTPGVYMRCCMLRTALGLELMIKAMKYVINVFNISETSFTLFLDLLVCFHSWFKWLDGTLYYSNKYFPFSLDSCFSLQKYIFKNNT